ncbi:MAG: chromosome segregation protein SMC [Firmicutes bacterium]|nr:chromosome segregation protein SMC [Bacillota bacterium]
MRLISLEMQGFKSFPDRTKIKFNRGSTVIVGPNGSGKSNITDALRWVLGELSSKNLRGTKMEDVIFAGADGKSPMGYAEVSVTFDNTDESGSAKINLPYDEVTVTRRYYKAGESEYFINRRAVRLRDINELFMNTGIGREGYSIVGQGRVAEIISRKSDDRRAVFEDAAGIAKYRYKYRETERQLAATDGNMERLRDILSEVEGRVGPLAKEADAARRYLELYERCRRADVSLSIYDADRLEADGRRADDDILITSHELEMINDTLARLEAQSDRISESFSENKLTSERVYEEIKDQNAKIRELERSYADISAKIEHSKSRAEEYRKDADTAGSQKESVAAETDELSAKIDALLEKAELCGKTADELNSSLALATDEYDGLSREVDELFTKIRDAEGRAVDCRVRINVLSESLKSDGEKDDGTQLELEKYKREAAQLSQSFEKEDKNVRDFGLAVENSEKKISELEKKLSETDALVAEISKEREGVAANAAAADGKIDALTRLEESFEGYGKSIKYVMDGVALGKIRGGVHGPISRIITVPPEYVTAIEIALGANLQNIVVDDESAAKECIYYLKNGGAGRATFYPLTSIKAGYVGRETENAAKFGGYIGLASELVSFDEKYGEIVRYTLGRTCVFDTIDSASAAAKANGYKIRAVTLDGQQINAGGSFTGGSVRRDSGMLTRAGEIRSLRAERSLISRELKRIDEKLTSAKARRTEYSGQLADEKNRRDITDAMMRASMTSRDAASAKRDAALTLASELEEDFLTRQTQKGKSEEDMKSLKEALESVIKDADELKSKREALSVKANAAGDKKNEIAEKISSLALDMAKLESEISANRALLSEKIKRRDEYAEKNDTLLIKAAELDAEVESLLSSGEENRGEYEERKASLEELEARRESLEAGSLEYERRRGEIYKKVRERTDEKEKIVRAHMKNEENRRKIKDGYDKIIAHLWDEYELKYSSEKELDYPKTNEQNRAETARELSECKSGLKSLGSVNVGAIEEYGEVRERYENLSRQMNDLISSREDLNDVMEELRLEMQTAFSDAFNSINEKFGEVFRELFGGGEAELYLSDPTDVLSSGIEIKAAPPGKVIKNLSLLSGGEQAFVGIALLFAMIQVNPTPFCVFDEIESALDEVNVARFADYLSNYSDKIQFVVITHRRGTMERADTLYGVTMPRRGVSRVLTLDPGSGESEKYVSENASE